MQTTARVAHFTATEVTLNQIAELVVQTRPDWNIYDVRAVLIGHAHQVDGADLAIASIRCATSLRYDRPAAIGWRGPHWDGLDTKPTEVRDRDLCDTCGKTEPRCYGERVGKDDDHVFSPRRRLVS